MRENFLPWIDRFAPRATFSPGREAALLVIGVAAIALGAQISVPMTPVPMTLQTLSVVLVGALYGAKRGMVTTAAYLLCGVLGLPVFAKWSAAPGLEFLSLKSGGYILGFILAAGLIGLLVRRIGYGRPLALTIAMLGGHGAVLLVGVAWLAAFIGPSAAVQHGLLPFLPGMVAKSVAAAALVILCSRVAQARDGAVRA